MKSNKKTWLFIALGLFVLLVGAVLSSSRQPESYPPYLSSSPSPTGVKALYEFASFERDMSRWRQAPDVLPDQQQSALFMVEPYYTLTTEESNAYTAWMERGNTIVFMKQNPTGSFGTRSVPAMGQDGPVTVTGFGESYRAIVEQTFRLVPGEEDEVLLEDGQGPLAIQRSYGEGKLIVSMNPGWAANGTILNEDHAYLIDQLLKDVDAGRVLFDEYIHGSENVPTVLTIYPKWILVFALQLIILAVLWLWMKGKRFGPVFTPREHTVRLGDERLHALSAWYIRGGFYQESIRIQEEYLRSLLYKRYGIGMKESWQEVRESIAKFQTEDEQKRWRSYTHGLDDLQSMRKTDYLKWSKKLDDLRKEVQGD
ncbi:DUF4350 domain-containing protein [Halobacillus litoralis]|uniref:DUF4350 domain-containing protein n=1 Tax=Halobacillus litoralis TaxID=45668 RepID=UPI001CD45145|nr:DUF4350 domain-containing protein [Halobacillus litoralis]MCA0971302.1 DUF4350 domain-containing protein [Halobacillus litoralis]